MQWKIEIEVWPYSTGAGSAEDKKAVGERSHQFVVPADDIHEAVKKAELIVQGIKTNPRVWQAPIMGITRKA